MKRLTPVRALTLVWAIVLVLLTTAYDVYTQPNGVGARLGLYHQGVTKRGDVVAAIEPRLEPFFHGVASGDPLSTSVIIWTRVTPRNGENNVVVKFVVCTDPDLTQVVSAGEKRATPERDFTVKVDVQGLQPGTTYYYGFRAYDKNSLTGRTKTMPVGEVNHARVAVLTCSNYPAGFFNAYGRIAARNDLDVVLHMGDYIYEYSADSTSYAGATGIAIDRRHEPNAEIVNLADYRTRYSQYRLDPDLRAMHQQHPVVHVWDDHESANDSYSDGAENHDPSEGSWQTRKAVSKQVYFEWMPIRENEQQDIYRATTIGSLANIVMLDTRLEGRDKQVSAVGSNAPQASKDSLADPSRKIMSDKQLSWVVDEFTLKSTTWKILGSQVLFTPVVTEPIDTAFLFEAVGPILAGILRTQVSTLQDLFTTGFNADVWSNYPVQRSELLRELESENVQNVVVVSGDFHTSYAFDGNWPTQKVNLVEFMTPSVTSPNFDENYGGSAILELIGPQLVQSVDTTLAQLNPHCVMRDLTNHGSMILDITPEKIQADWFFVDTLLIRSSNDQWYQGWHTSGSGTLQRAVSAANEKQQQDIPAPPNPPESFTSVEDTQNAVAILGYGPVPASSYFYLSLANAGVGPVSVDVVSATGQIVYSLETQSSIGLQTITVPLNALPSGAFFVRVTQAGMVQTIKGVVQR